MCRLKVRALAFVVVLTQWNLSAAEAQPAAPDQHQHGAVEQPAHDMSQMEKGDVSSTRAGSGTSWLPADSPMYAFHTEAGKWMVMAHGNAFLQYFHDTGDRGSHQLGSINWLMTEGARPLGTGRVTVRGMVSLEPFTIAGCGYPDLLASGEVCGGESIHDRQHPHDLFMELAASYERGLTRGLQLQLYGGPAGEPALGPASFPHRLSAMVNPLAPMTHHWLDATHISYGVLTAGVFNARWKVEGSVFNGREPDENRTGFDFAAMDSYSGRVTFAPARQWAIQASAGHLTEAEAGHAGEPRTDVTRLTASAIYHRRLGPRSMWASTIAWGRNDEPDRDATDALLAETSVTIDERDVWFGRFELADKSAHDLDVPGGERETFAVAKLQAGYTRYLAEWNGLQPGYGAGISAGFVPESLSPFYGRRFNPGFAIYVTLRPAGR